MSIKKGAQLTNLIGSLGSDPITIACDALLIEGLYDQFLGSGTTLAASELTERACYGLELDPKYVDVIVQRWQQLTRMCCKKGHAILIVC